MLQVISTNERQITKGLSDSMPVFHDFTKSSNWPQKLFKWEQVCQELKGLHPHEWTQHGNIRAVLKSPLSLSVAHYLCALLNMLKKNERTKCFRIIKRNHLETRQRTNILHIHQSLVYHTTLSLPLNFSIYKITVCKNLNFNIHTLLSKAI